MTTDESADTRRTGKQALVIYSPDSGRARQLPHALSSLENAGLKVGQAIPISDLRERSAQGQNWLEQGIEVVVAAGGDGVIGSTINHLAGSGLPLGIMPLGTSNDIARSLDIPLALEDAARTLAGGQTRMIDLGAAYPLDPSRAFSEQVAEGTAPIYGYFAHVLTIGLNVHFAQIATNVATRKRYGRLTYPVAALEVLRNPEVLPVRLQFEGLQFPPHRQQRINRQFSLEYAELSSRALQVTVINAPIFGGAWQIALPGSSLEDEVLDVVVFEEFGSGQLGARLASFFNSPPLDTTLQGENRTAETFLQHPAELTGLPGIHHLQARGIAISTGQDPRPITLDGEIRGQTPLYVRLLRHFLPVCVPAAHSTP